MLRPRERVDHKPVEPTVAGEVHPNSIVRPPHDAPSPLRTQLRRPIVGQPSSSVPICRACGAAT